MQRRIRLTGLLLISFLMSLLVLISQAQDEPKTTPEPTQSMAGMSSMARVDTEFSVDDLAPLVRGIFEGEDIFFVHTETSNPDISMLLTDMMEAEVITVFSLAEIPSDLLGNVYVFTNGDSGGGPMGFQSDLFDSVPSNEDYTPLENT